MWVVEGDEMHGVVVAVCWVGEGGSAWVGGVLGRLLDRVAEGWARVRSAFGDG